MYTISVYTHLVVKVNCKEHMRLTSDIEHNCGSWVRDQGYNPTVAALQGGGEESVDRMLGKIEIPNLHGHLILLKISRDVFYSSFVLTY